MKALRNSRSSRHPATGGATRPGSRRPTPLGRPAIDVKTAGALLTLTAVLLLGGLVPSAAQAAPGPWWHLSSNAHPARIAPGGEGTLVVRAENVGDLETTGAPTFSTELPPGLEAQGVSFFATRLGEANFAEFELEPGVRACQISTGKVVCAYPENPEFPALQPFEWLEMQIAVKNVGTPVPDGESRVAISGGGAPAASMQRAIALEEGAVGFGVEEFRLVPEEEGGEVDTQAGSHPYQLTTTFALNQTDDGARPPALARNLQFRLPPGLVGNATVMPQCSEADFFDVGEAGVVDQCAPDTAVGAVVLTFNEPNHIFERSFPLPIFNIAPGRGEPARFGFTFAGTAITLDTAVRSGAGPRGEPPDYGITVSNSNITQLVNLLSATVTFWGSPADLSHANSRGWSCLAGDKWGAEIGLSCSPSGQAEPPAFLTMPTSCTSPFSATLEGESWASPVTAAEPLPAASYELEDGAGRPLSVGGCNQLPFAPKIDAESTSGASSSPSGLNFDLNFEDEGLLSAHGLAQSQVERAVVTLPPGFITNPALAGGLSACAEAAYEAEGIGAPSDGGCPESSKIGEVEIDSPLVAQPIKGSLFVARQGENPNANNLLTIYLVARNPELGILVRQALKVTPDPITGQLTTEVDGIPQLPFSHFHLAFRSGQRAPLITPATCGSYTAKALLYPYSNPEQSFERNATLTIGSGTAGAPCASSESQLPNRPRIEAGTTNPVAGAYAPFVFKVSREDGSQGLGSISATLPEGLLGKLAGVGECPDAAIAQAESRSGEGQGARELASPSCPESSQVGTVNVGVGAGSQPYYVQGKAYLAGPYKGAPLSLAIITPAVVGPFDLGTIVVRTALYVDESTAQITAKSDPIPTIVHGLPTVVRSVSLDMDRANFTLNPTSCDPKLVTGSATSTLGNVAPLSQRFQVGACGALAFRPTLKLSFSGQTKRTGNPAVKAVLTQPKGDNANIARTSVVLPKGMLIAEAHINDPCTRVQFNSTPVPGEACPKKSVLGHAKVWTPLLEKPEEGPVYFRSNGGERELPDLVVALRGRIPVQLVGFVDSIGRKGAEVRRVRTRFQSVPDAPISRFELKLSGGKKGLLENSQNLCKAKQLSKFQITGQNGKAYDTEPAVAVACGKGHKKSKSGKKK